MPVSDTESSAAGGADLDEAGMDVEATSQTQQSQGGDAPAEPSDDDEHDDNDNEEDDDDEANKEADTNNITRACQNSQLKSKLGYKREIGSEGIWSLSTAKPGNGIDQLRDESLETYWQSDGMQPHTISIQFPKRATVSQVCLYLDFNLDESYTPKEIIVKVGMTFHDLEELTRVQVSEPVGWIVVDIPVSSEQAARGHGHDIENDENLSHVEHGFVRTHFIQICIPSMHQNGRDTHVRLVKIFGPRRKTALLATGDPLHRRDVFDAYGTAHGGFSVAMSQFDTIR